MAVNLMNDLGASEAERLEKIQMRPICEKIIKKVAGWAFGAMLSSLVHSESDKIADKTDKNNDNVIELLEFKIFLRGTFLYLAGTASKAGVAKISEHAWKHREIDYKI